MCLDGYRGPNVLEDGLFCIEGVFFFCRHQCSGSAVLLVFARFEACMSSACSVGLSLDDWQQSLCSSHVWPWKLPFASSTCLGSSSMIPSLFTLCSSNGFIALEWKSSHHITSRGLMCILFSSVGDYWAVLPSLCFENIWSKHWGRFHMRQQDSLFIAS